MKPTVLIVCTGNSCRSQMAEAFLRHAAGDAALVLSAGSKPAAVVHPLAVRVMAELGFDLSGQRPKHLREFRRVRDEMKRIFTAYGTGLREGAALRGGCSV